MKDEITINNNQSNPVIGFIILIFIFIFVYFAVSHSMKNSDANSSNNDEMVIATCQLVLKEYTLTDYTSPLLNDWTISNQDYSTTKRWTATTYDEKNKRVKCIFDWSGNNADDLILKYLLYNGEEYVNDL